MTGNDIMATISPILFSYVVIEGVCSAQAHFGFCRRYGVAGGEPAPWHLLGGIVVVVGEWGVKNGLRYADIIFT